MLIFFFKAIQKMKYLISNPLYKACTIIKFRGNDIKYKNFRTNGIPFIMRALGGGECTIGNNFSMNNGINGNPIGCYERCTIIIDKGANLFIGENVGISQTAIVAHDNITIGNNVKIGGGTCIYTSDFHSLDYEIRKTKLDIRNRKTAPIKIGDDVFIGAKCIILKGVTIGNKSIIGAGSVVTKNIPDSEIWAGNPAKFIRKI